MSDMPDVIWAYPNNNVKTLGYWNNIQLATKGVDPDEVSYTRTDLVDDLTKQLSDANKILREMETYLRKGSKQTAIYQGSGFHKEIREYFGAALSPQEPTTT